MRKLRFQSYSHSRNSKIGQVLEYNLLVCVNGFFTSSCYTHVGSVGIERGLFLEIGLHLCSLFCRSVRNCVLLRSSPPSSFLWRLYFGTENYKILCAVVEFELYVEWRQGSTGQQVDL